MKNFTPVSFAVAGLFMIGISYSAFTNSGGRGGATSGSPESNNLTCAQCHSGGTLSAQTIEITTDIPTNGFLPNTDYNVTVKSNANGGLGTKMGFNATVEPNGSSGFAGTVTSPDNQTQVFGNAVTHTGGSNTPSNGEKSWTFTWNSGNTQTATIYAAGLFANGNGTTSGDAVLTNTLVVQKSSLGTDEWATSDLKLFPNPAKQVIHLEGTLTSTGQAEIEIYSLTGELVLQQDAGNNGSLLASTLDITALSAGTYSLVIKVDDKVSTSKFVKVD